MIDEIPTMDITNPYRKSRRLSSKMIFVACEGQVTEEMYFDVVKRLYEVPKSKIRILSVNDDIRKISKKNRTKEQIKLLSEGQPLQLVERLNKFREDPDKKNEFRFDEHPEDEFWIIVDVDRNWDTTKKFNQKSLKDKWDDAINQCKQNKYNYAVSNPFFEVWLLLHHDDLNNEDRKFAVTGSHNYKKTNHFKERLRNLHVGLRGKNKKEIVAEHYSIAKIEDAVRRCEVLHTNKADLEPQYCCSTVYMLLREIINFSVV